MLVRAIESISLIQKKTKLMFRIKFLPSFLIALLTSVQALSCPVCERQQPKIIRGISHGVGPDSNWDYLIIIAMVIIVLITLFFSLRYLLSPGEKSEQHIKRFILNTEEHE